MVKSVFYRLIGRSTDAIPYGTHDEEQSLHVVTPVKYATVLEHSVTATVVNNNNATEPLGFVQKVRNSLRRKKKNRDYDLFADRPSPFSTPPAFLAERQASPTLQNWDSPFGLEVLEQCVTKKKAGQHQLKVNFAEESHEPLTQNLSSLFENEENGRPSATPQTDLPPSTSENIGFDPEDTNIEAYFKTPDGIRKYHRRSKVFLSVKEDHLI